jgi:hypothetical protein
MALVSGAKSSAAGLAGQLVVEITQQRDASAIPLDSSGLTTLADLSPAELSRLLKTDPEFFESLWDNPPDASTVAGWWKGLSKDEQQRLIKDAPTIIGNLNGVPYGERNAANQIALTEAEHDGSLTEEQKNTVTQVERALKVANSLPGTPKRFLIDFNLSAQPPMAAVAVGDVDTADDVTVDVPGMDTRAPTSMASWTVAAQNLYDQQQTTDPSHTHAVIAWIGYAPPQLTATMLDPTGNDSVFSNVQAEQGGQRLASELDAIHDTRAGEGTALPRVAVVGHSYGTTTAADALTLTKYNVNSVDFVASAGIDEKLVPNETYMHVETVNGTEQVFATQSSMDNIATIGRDGSGRVDPRDSSFGAVSYGSDGSGTLVAVHGHDAVGEGNYVPILKAGAGHGYFDVHSESLANMAVATTGTGQFVTAPVPHPSPLASPTPLPTVRTK